MVTVIRGNGSTYPRRDKANMTFENGKPLPAEKYETQIKERRKSNLIFFGLACIIVFGLLVILGQPAQALGQFNASMPGERNIGDLFEFIMNNVSGQENVTHHFTVYSSKLYDINQSYEYWSVSSGQWLNQSPEKGKRWLFIWVEDWTDGSPTWAYDKDRFTVWVNGNLTVNPEPIQMQDIKARQGEKLKPAIIEGVTYGHPVNWRNHNYYGDPYGWRDGIEMPYIQTGKSNSWSGWIKYQVPDSAELKDIRVAGWFLNHGTAYWNLVATNFSQVTATPTPAAGGIQIPVQQDVERRSDQPGAPVIDGRIRA